MAKNKYLLDTHSVIWFQENNSRISDQAVEFISHPDNIILFSQVNIFELVIKQKIGKLPNFIATVQQVYEQAISDGFSYVNVNNSHLFKYSDLPLFDNHRDPFDRLLIATAITENAAIISGDEKFKLYKDIVEVIW